ncbi:50S ribosomal protein L10 [Candidatus Gracilibacteria bacterium]|nr:50S ribosomal protein L10 [Candidatus Gracilibacteria bacterium]
MAITRQKKIDQLAALEEKFKNGAGVAFAKFSGPTVNEVQEIRRALRKDGMSYTVIKKTLIALAAKNAKIADFSSDDLDGNVAVIVSDNDAIMPATTIKNLKKDFFDRESKTSKFDFAGAIFESRLLNEEETAILANTPSREESLAKIIGTLRYGPRGIGSALIHGLRGITMALKEADKFAKT